jgi:glycosyltransferase involved in cell wall biosynthesis
MKVLITNIWLVDRGGTEVYTRDLAIALYKRGVRVEVYSPELGAVAEEIRQAGIHITDSISALRNSPDIIHAHHTKPTLEVLRAFPDTPAVYLIHDRVYPGDSPPHHRQIIKYMASDYNTLERLLEEGIPEQHTGVMLNWVDTKKFALRKHWSEKPRKALVFSNYATRDNHLGIIQQACDLAGLELDCIGRGVGNAVDKPENFLGSYDIVFAKAKAAIEALATGAMVIPCDFRGLGET